jgi:D-aspartate ligase
VALRQKKCWPGAIILGSDFKALGVVRSLGRQGIPSIVIDNVPRSAWFSRYVVKHFLWQGPMDDSALFDFLLQISQKHSLEQWVLFPLQDEVVEFVARNAQELGQTFRLVTQGWDIVQWAGDKRLTHRLAQEAEVPYPKTWYPTREEDLNTMEIAFPLIIKPAISIRLQNATRLKALPANNYEELLAQYRFATTIIEPDQIMLQEIIPGDGRTQYSVASYCKEGHTLIHMSARRTRQYPIDYGLSSSFVEAIEVPCLFALAERLLSSMRVSGMVEVEFKYDIRDGQYKLLDINTRPWGWHTLCIACGIDFPALQYYDALGQVPSSYIPRYDYRWVRMLTDIPAGIQEVRAGITTPSAYLHSLMGKIVFSVFDWRDPLPTLGDFAVALFRYMKRSKRMQNIQNSAYPVGPDEGRSVDDYEVSTRAVPKLRF